MAPRSSRRRPPWAWRVLVGAVAGLLRGVFGWRVRVAPPRALPPPDRPLVVVFNHTSAVDGFLVADTLWRGLRRWVRPLVKAELLRWPLLGRLGRLAGGIPVAREHGAGRGQAYDQAVAALQAGSTVLFAPEGTITHDGRLLPLRHGAARLALDAGCDVLVVTHFGAQRAFSPVVRLPERGTVVTVTLDLLSPAPDEDAAALTGRIAAVLLDRSESLQASYPQADPDAPWWPPYAAPAAPTRVARESLERYQESMAEAVERARERMARYAEEHDLERRLADARARVQDSAADLSSRSRHLTDEARERAETVAAEARQRLEELSDHARARLEQFGRENRAPADRPTDDAQG